MKLSFSSKPIASDPVHFDPVIVFDEGYQSAFSGAADFDCPYSAGSVARRVWLDGYLFGKQSQPLPMGCLIEPLFKS